MKRIIKFICFLIVLSLFSLPGVFAQVADAGPDTTICNGNSIQIGSSGSDPSWCFTWSPDSTLNDKKAPDPSANPVSTTEYNLTVVGPDFSFTDKDKMTVKVIDPKVKFLEYPNQKYGFDSYGINKNVPWKALKSGDIDYVVAEIKPVADISHVYFKSSDPDTISVTEKQASTEFQGLSLTGILKGNTELQANGDEEEGVNLNKMNVASYNEQSKTLAIIQIVEENDDTQNIKIGQGLAGQFAIEAGINGILDSNPVGDDKKAGNRITTGLDGICQTPAILDDIQIIKLNQGEPNTYGVMRGHNNFLDTKKASGDDSIFVDFISTGLDGICNTAANDSNIITKDIPDYVFVETYLKQVYDQAVIKWTITKISGCAVNYDLDRNDSLDVSTFWMNNEMNQIRVTCGDLSYDKNIFLVHTPSNSKVLGLMDFNQPYGFIFLDKRISYIGNTIAHELGHGLGLFHTYETVDESTTDPVVKDPDNIMHPTLTGWRFRKDQWDQLNP